jgi:mono/diheme cytochrome c family protein
LFRVVALGLVGAALLLLAGCGGEEATGLSGADPANGKTLFSQKCGSCHALADAATVSDVGPNLDNAFGYACAQGFPKETFFDVVRAQIDLPARDGQMPADLVTGQDAADVAAYVAGVAGKDVPGCGEGEGGTTTTGTTTGGAQTGSAAGG